MWIEVLGQLEVTNCHINSAHLEVREPDVVLQLCIICLELTRFLEGLQSLKEEFLLEEGYTQVEEALG